MNRGDLDLALDLVAEAAAITVPAQRRGEIEIATKADGSVVTDVDLAVEERLRNRLADVRPNDRIVGEEYGELGDASRCWYLDPIDGTTSFVDGSDRWGTLVALVEDGRVVVGVVDFPRRRRRYWAAANQGAHSLDGVLRVSRSAELRAATVCDDYRRSIERATAGHPLCALAARGCAVLPHDGNSLVAVASGRGDIAVGTGGGPWDYAPLVLIVEEAGGRVTDRQGESRFDTGFIVATNGLLHTAALEVISSEVQSHG